MNQSALETKWTLARRDLLKYQILQRNPLFTRAHLVWIMEDAQRCEDWERFIQGKELEPLS